MAEKNTRRVATARATTNAPRIESRPLVQREPLLLRLARLLDPAELEVALLTELRTRIPHAVAMVSLDPGAIEPSRIADDQGVRRWRAGQPPPRLLAVPLSDEGEASGWIAYLDDAALRPHKAAAAAQLIEIAAAAAIPSRNARRHAVALELTLRDPLTGLYNRRAYSAFLEREEQRAQRTGAALSLAIIDLDYFKSLNDRYGHPIGDRALQTLARVLTDAVRRSDIVTRPGGDEFVVVLPDTPVSGAARIVARIRKRLSEMRLEVGAGIEPIQLAISCGIADLEAAGGDCEQLVRLADEALYEAKRAGRNQTARAGG